MTKVGYRSRSNRIIEVEVVLVVLVVVIVVLVVEVEVEIVVVLFNLMDHYDELFKVMKLLSEF